MYLLYWYKSKNNDTDFCAAGPLPYNFYCPKDTPVGEESRIRAVTSAAGMLCWDTIADCYGGPNGCTEPDKTCVQNQTTLVTQASIYIHTYTHTYTRTHPITHTSKPVRRDWGPGQAR
jgi:hypothetical protein